MPGKSIKAAAAARAAREPFPPAADWRPGAGMPAPDAAALAALLTGSGEALFIHDARGIIRFWNAGAEALLGMPGSDAIGRPSSRVFAEGRPADASEGEAAKWETIGLRPDGNRVPVELSAGPAMAGPDGFVLVTARDLAERKGWEDAIRDSEERHLQARDALRDRIRFEDLITSVSTHFIHLPSERIDMGINYALRSLGEFARVDRSYIFLFSPDGKRADNAYEWCAPGIEPRLPGLQGLDTERFPWFMERIRALGIVRVGKLEDLPAEAAAERAGFAAQGIRSMVAVPMAFRGTIRGYLGFDSLRGGRNWSEDESHVLRMAAEIFISALERKRMEHQLMHDSLHDALTGLPNRSLLLERLGRALKRARRERGAYCAVLAMDLDRFKFINEGMGHTQGDRLLVALSRRLEAYLPPGTTLARLGADEFCILAEDLRDPAQAETLAERALDALSLAFDLDGHEVYAAASIGIAIGGGGTDGPGELLREADTAMHRAKSAGKGRFEVFDASMHAKAVKIMTLENDLRKALERQEFRLHYQPIVSLEDRHLMGFEALIRWIHPKLGMVSPVDFIPLAEDTGLIVPIGRWVLWQSLRQLAEWQGLFADGKSLTMSVNLSGKQLRDADLVRQVQGILAESGVAPGSLKLEVTESAIMENPDQAAAILNGLRDMGVQLSLDDFGTGYSSLSYLHRFPFHDLKIDRSFVSKLEAGDKDSEIVKVINSLAKNLGMDVVAEGIETEAQWSLLRDLACRYGQGYLFSKPLEDGAARKLIEGGGFPSRGPQLPPAVPGAQEAPTAAKPPVP
jgi:diguanylate cyclase (GGDEF)-like protein/PAS domain S-box-containing protein